MSRVATALNGNTPVTTVPTTGYQYDGNGNLVQKTDADGRVTLFAYDALNRETGEQWYDSSDNLSNVIAYTYDLDGELYTAGDDSSSYTYGYNSLGQQISVDNNGSQTNGTPGVPDVVLGSAYDAAGNRTSLSATIGGTADFVNAYTYDDLNRQTQITQGPGTATGHDAVDDKLVNFTYNADGQLASIDRFNDLTGLSGDRVATSAYGYDDFGRLTGLTHTAADGSTTYAAYAWTYDAASQVTSFANSASVAGYSGENVASYAYDHDGQLTGATQPTGQTANAANSFANPAYDANGNAGSIGRGSTTIGAGNTLLFDGTYNDTYDANGNLVEQAGATAEHFYTYDNRNRLTGVTDYLLESGNWVKSEEIDYTYDVFNNLIGRQATTYGTGGGTSTARYVFDGTSMVLAFDGSGNLTDRYLWGPMVDQVLADEHFSLSGSDQLPATAGSTLWSLGDNQNSVRDVVTDGGTLEQHIAYSPFGQQVTALTTTGSVVANFAFGYTGTYTDVVTADQLHGVRWYDPASQRWLTPDPIGTKGGVNLYEYAGDSPADATDPTGMQQKSNGPAAPDWATYQPGGALTQREAQASLSRLEWYQFNGQLALTRETKANLAKGKLIRYYTARGAFQMHVWAATGPVLAPAGMAGERPGYGAAMVVQYWLSTKARNAMNVDSYSIYVAERYLSPDPKNKYGDIRRQDMYDQMKIGPKTNGGYTPSPLQDTLTIGAWSPQGGGPNREAIATVATYITPTMHWLAADEGYTLEYLIGVACHNSKNKKNWLDAMRLRLTIAGGKVVPYFPNINPAQVQRLPAGGSTAVGGFQTAGTAPVGEKLFPLLDAIFKGQP